MIYPQFSETPSASLQLARGTRKKQQDSFCLRSTLSKVIVTRMPEIGQCPEVVSQAIFLRDSAGCATATGPGRIAFFSCIADWGSKADSAVKTRGASSVFPVHTAESGPSVPCPTQVRLNMRGKSLLRMQEGSTLPREVTDPAAASSPAMPGL